MNSKMTFYASSRVWIRSVRRLRSPCLSDGRVESQIRQTPGRKMCVWGGVECL